MKKLVKDKIACNASSKISSLLLRIKKVYTYTNY